MAYNNFTLDSVKNQFKLKLSDYPFCETIPLVEPQAIILDILNQWLPIAEASRTEKARSEMLVSPILLEAKRLANERIQIFSGEEFNVDKDRKSVV